MSSRAPLPSPLLTTLAYTTAFVCGFVVLALEILGFRLFAPFFGYTVYVSGTLVTVVLAALSLGYWLGGRVADRRPDLAVMFLMILGAGCYLAVMAALHQRLLLVLSRGSAVGGTIAAGVVIFWPPMLLLSTVSPFLIKVLSQHAGEPRVGSIAGSVSAVSTVGSIAGSAVTTFVFVPAIGSRMTFVLCTLVAVVLPLLYLPWRSRRFWWLAALVPAVLFLRPPLIVESGVVLVRESPYNLIKLLHEDGQYKLRLNDTRNTQSRYPSGPNPSTLCTGAYTDIVSVAPMLAEGNRVLILGLGGGESANQMHLMHEADVHGVEIDPGVVSIAEKYFGIRALNPGIGVHVEDARRFVRSGRPGRYDVIEVDLYHGGLYIPFYCATREFFDDVCRMLDSGGVMVMNVLCDNVEPDSSGLYASVAATIASVFPSVHEVRTPSIPNNAVVFAFRSPTLTADIVRRLSAAGAAPCHPDAARMADTVLAHVVPHHVSSGARILTDDRAPVEQLTARLIGRIVARETRRLRS